MRPGVTAARLALDEVVGVRIPGAQSTCRASRDENPCPGVVKAAGCDQPLCYFDHAMDVYQRRRLVALSAIAVVFILFVLLIRSCGGDDAETTPTPLSGATGTGVPTSLAQADYIAQADPICLEANTSLDDVDESDPVQADSDKSQIVAGELQQLQTLPAPDDGDRQAGQVPLRASEAVGGLSGPLDRPGPRGRRCGRRAEHDARGQPSRRREGRCRVRVPGLWRPREDRLDLEHRWWWGWRRRHRVDHRHRWHRDPDRAGHADDDDDPVPVAPPTDDAGTVTPTPVAPAPTDGGTGGGSSSGGVSP